MDIVQCGFTITVFEYVDSFLTKLHVDIEEASELSKFLVQASLQLADLRAQSLEVDAHSTSAVTKAAEQGTRAADA